MKNILIIEDNSDLAKSIAEFLGPEHYTCFFATCGRTGYTLARNNNYDLIIADIRLPNLDGISIVKMLRNEQIDPPIIMISSDTDIDQICRAIELGADDYVTKPFSMYELKARIDRFLKRPPTTKADVIYNKELIINLATHEVIYNDNHIDLQKKELEILRYFLKNQGQLITREKILNNLWTMDDEPYPTTVDVHISNIRRKLQKAGATNTIKTVRGIGFIWEETS